MHLTASSVASQAKPVRAPDADATINDNYLSANQARPAGRRLGSLGRLADSLQPGAGGFAAP